MPVARRTRYTGKLMVNCGTKPHRCAAVQVDNALQTVRNHKLDEKKLKKNIYTNFLSLRKREKSAA